MANLVFDFLHNYKTGERRESDPADAYQYDEGHVFEAVVPVAVTSCEIHYWARGFDEAEAYTPASITQNTDNSYTITGNIPNKFFETYGDLRVYIVVTDGDASITTYEGRIHICERSKPDDYVDDDPDNEATRVLVEARAAAATATEAAQTAQDVADSIPADYTQLSDDVSALKEDSSNLKNAVDVGYIELSSNDFELNGWSISGEKITASRMIRNKTPITVNPGDVFVYSTGTLYINWFMLDDQGNQVIRVPNSESFFSKYTDKSYEVTQPGKIYITFRNGQNYNKSTDISPSDYDGTLLAQNTLASRNAKRIAVIENGIGQVYRETGSDTWQIGTIYHGEIDGSNTKRICDATYIPVGIKTIVKTSKLEMVVNTYDDAKQWIAVSNWSKNDFVIENESVRYIRVLLKVSDSHVFNQEELEEYKNTVTVCYTGNTVADIISGDGVDTKTIRDKTYNSSFHTGANDFSTKCTEFSSLLLGDSVNNVTAPTNFETFLFFTDPHLMQNSGWENRCYELVTQIQKYYNSTPTTFCLCGGDWLGNSDLPETACYKLGYIDGFMHSKFNDCYLLVGNHDTNYQGKKDATSERGTTRLSNQSIIDLWYRKDKKAYYTIEGANTVFYCFDTGVEAQALTEFDNYGLTQCQWFASCLSTEQHEHIAIATHILYNQNPTHGVLHYLMAEILNIAKAYNDRSTISVNGTVYNFADVTGHVAFVIAGHSHADYNGLINGIPYVMTINAGAEDNIASFDLIFADYTNNLIKCIRVGSGANRTISMLTGELI